MSATDEIKKKILIEVQAKTEALKRQSAELNGSLDTIKAKMKEVEQAAGKGSIAYVEQAAKLRETQKAIRDTNREYDNATRALKAQTNSIDQNRALLATLTAEHIKLSQAEGTASKAAQAMAAQMKSVHDVLVVQEKAYGDSHRVIGEYERGTAGLTETLKDHIAANSSVGLVYNQVSNAAASLSAVMGHFKNVITDFNGVIGTQIKNENLLKQAKIEEAAASEANLAAQEMLTAGTITAAEAEAINARAIAAKTVVQELSTVATTRAETALKLLKIALASTGIGLLIIALGTLVAYFEETNEGSKKFKVILAQLNALFQETMKIIAPIGKAIFDAFGSTAGIQFFSSALMTVLIPLRTIMQVLSDLKNGNFSEAFKDIGRGVKDWAQNQVDGFNAGLQLTQDLTTNLGKAADEIKRNGVNYKNAAAAAAVLTVERQKLTKAEREWSEEKIKQQGEVDLLVKKFRDMNLTEKERLANGEKAKVLRKSMFETDLKYANMNEQLVEREQALKSKKDYQAITDAKNHVQELKNQYDMDVQNIENRQSKIENGQRKHKESLQEKMGKALSETEKIRLESHAKELQAIYDAYGDELVAADLHQKEESNKIAQFHKDKLISEAEYIKTHTQLEAEHHQTIQNIMDKYALQDAAKVEQASNELMNLTIVAIKNSTEKQIAQLKEQEKEKLQQLDHEAGALLKQHEQQGKEVQDLKNRGLTEEAAAVQKAYEATGRLLQLNGKKRVEITAQTREAIQKINQDMADADQANIDEVDVLKAGDHAGPRMAALLNQLENEHEAEMRKAGLTASQKLLLDQQYEEKKKELKEQYAQAFLDKAKTYETMVQQAALSILRNNLQQSTQEKSQALSDQKSKELSNTSLTSGQKSIIEEKYRKLEYKAKVDAFKKQQKLDIAQALINGALGLLKTTANVGFPISFALNPLVIAQTALEIGVIAAQKPPAYARGGLHYSSDGRGGVLPGYSKTDNTNAYLRSGEAVVVSEAMQNPWARSIVSAINQSYGGRPFSGAVPYNGWLTPGFAAGGVFSGASYLPTFENSSRASAGLPVDEMAFKIGEQIQKMPVPNIYVDVKDVNHQQGILAQTINRVDL